MGQASLGIYIFIYWGFLLINIISNGVQKENPTMGGHFPFSLHFVHPELDPDVVRIDPGAVINWGRTSAHAHAPVPSGRVPMWAIEVLLHRLPRFECSSVFSHLDIHDRVDQCVFTPGYPVIPHHCQFADGSSPLLPGWRPGEGANCAPSIGDIPHFPRC